MTSFARQQSLPRAGKPLSVVDGVPVAVKDEFKQIGHRTCGGTSFLGSCVESEDATAVARLRAAGALLVGKTVMNEIGIQTTGWNGHFGQVRNPFDLSRDTGGSSSGSAASVAAGLTPLALGADGGGSIRIPATQCGVVGFKPTYGRVSEHGALPLCPSVGHAGPIASSVEDAAIMYAIIAGPDVNDANSQVQPPPSVDL